MTVRVFSGAAGSQISASFRLTCVAWRGLTRRHVLTALAVGAAVALWEILIAGPFLPFWFILPKQLLLQFLSETDFGALSELLRDEFVALILLLAVAIADRAVDTGRATRRAYVLAVVLAVGSACALAFAVAPYHGESLKPAIYSAMSWLMFGGLATFVYADRKRAGSTRERLGRAQLERTRRAKRMIESRLTAMQSRVEPQFLFNTLTQVRGLYESNPARAEILLDDLITYLRSAMPHMRDTSSTLAREIELVRSYLAIVRVRIGDSFSFDINMPVDAEAVRMPAMMLLPLIDQATHRLEPSADTASISIATVIEDGRLKLTIVDSGAAFTAGGAGEHAVASIRERLNHLFGKDGHLGTERTTENGTQVVMEIPHEVVEHSDR
jgi:hypothetical protein